MFLDYIEVGASDFDTEIQKDDTRKGLTVEPVPYYISRLPEKLGCTKINAAISDHSGISEVYYVPDHKISKYELPQWVRGCNSVGQYHPTVCKLLDSRGIKYSDAFESKRVVCMRLLDLVVANGISGFYYLKIDTEGHDTTIVKNYFENIFNTNHYPHVVKFESNSLSNSDDVDSVIKLCKSHGYDLVSRGHDTILKINLKKIFDKKIFSEKIYNYYITGYPKGYDTSNLPHDNTLSDAKKYCRDHGHSGVTYQYGSYEVRSGEYLEYYGPPTDPQSSELASWVFL